MSRYLIQRIEQSPNITLRTRSSIDDLQGDDHLQSVRWRHLDTGEQETRNIRNVFSMTGADPNTDWLAGCLLLDDKKFEKTGVDLSADELQGLRLATPPAALPDGDQHPRRVLRR